MNASKITVPQSVATAIRYYTDLHETKHEAFANILQLGYESEKSEAILRHFDGDYDLLMEALICGYQVERSPEEKVRELYDALVSGRNEYYGVSVTMHARYDLAVQSVRKALGFLGIKIEGVNSTGGDA